MLFSAYISSICLFILTACIFRCHKCASHEALHIFLQEHIAHYKCQYGVLSVLSSVVLTKVGG